MKCLGRQNSIIQPNVKPKNNKTINYSLEIEIEYIMKFWYNYLNDNIVRGLYDL